MTKEEKLKDGQESSCTSRVVLNATIWRADQENHVCLCIRLDHVIVQTLRSGYCMP
jgi:hypothetical protein